MSKVATITFHWSVNYGAVLQAYALQRYLLNRGVDTQLIDYLPRRVLLAQAVSAVKKRHFSYFNKKRKLRRFCKQELRLTKKSYRSNRALHRCRDFDAVICGSDQIWNESFTCRAEGKPTLSFYLNFLGDQTKRIAYSASFGTPKLSAEMQKLITPELAKFAKISVREKRGQELLRELKIDAELTLDPTMLLTAKDYLPLFEGRKCKAATKVFTYILHKNQTDAQKVCHMAQRHFGQKEADGGELFVDLQQWLYDLANAEFVVTNSFHGAVFSLLLHKPFVVLPVQNSGMNDRIETLMQAAGLSERIVTEPDRAQTLFDKPIDWNSVDARLAELRKTSENYLNEVIHNGIDV